MPISKNQTAILDACALEANRILFEKIGRYAQSVGANYLRSGDVQRALSALGRTLISRARAQCGSEHNARNVASIAIHVPIPRSRNRFRLKKSPRGLRLIICEDQACCQNFNNLCMRTRAAWFGPMRSHQVTEPGDGNSLLARSVRDFARASELVVAAIDTTSPCAGRRALRHPTRSSALGGIFTLHRCTSV